MTTEPLDPPTVLVRRAVQFAIAYRATFADLGAMNLAYDYPTGERAMGKRGSYVRVDYDLNREACDRLLDGINAPADVATRRAIIDVWNALAFGYDEGYAHGSGEDDPVTESDLSMYSIFARSSGEPVSEAPIFTHVPIAVRDPGSDEVHCGICGEDDVDDWQHITDNEAVYLIS